MSSPAHVTRQLPPVTFVTALTWTPEGRTALRVELVLGLVRTATPSHLVDSVVAPRTSDGNAAVDTVNRRTGGQNSRQDLCER